MTPENFKKLFAFAPERYPVHLSTQYSRVLQNILHYWESPVDEERYLSELVVDYRGNRQGFPPAVLNEILFISELYTRWKQDRSRRADPARLQELSAALVVEIDAAQSPLTEALSKSLMKLKVLISKDDPSALEFLNSSKINVNQRDIDGQTPLMYAASFGAEKSMLGLFRLNANPHMADGMGNTALHCAAAMNKLRVAEILLYFGADVNAKNKAGATPFALSVIKADGAMAKRLIDYHADVNIADNAGNTPLHKAVQAKSRENILTLLKAGASKDMRNRQGVSSGDLADSIPEVRQVFDKYRAEMLMNMGERI